MPAFAGMTFLFRIIHYQNHVIPAKAGISGLRAVPPETPAFAGVMLYFGGWPLLNNHRHASESWHLWRHGTTL